MLRILVLAAVLFSGPIMALDAGAESGNVGVPYITATDRVPYITVSDPVIKTALDGGAQVAIPDSVSLVKTVFEGVKTGNWWLVAGAFLVLVVSLLRSFGKKFHDWLPDNNILDKPLIFIYDTKIGGWVLNWITALAGGIGFALAAGLPVDFSLWKSVVMVSTSGTALFELWDDLMNWWKERKKEVPAPAPAPMPPSVEPTKPAA